MARAPLAIPQLDLNQAQRWRTLALPHVFERGGIEAGRAAIVYGAQQRTWGELKSQLRRVGNALVALGIEPGERVALLSKNRLEYFEIETGIAAACAIMVPINWRLKQMELESILNRSGAVAIILEAEFADMVRALQREGRVPQLNTLILIEGAPQYGELTLGEITSRVGDAPVPREPHFEDPHEIIFTSGTTGQPKGAVWTHAGLFFNSIQQVIDYRMGPESSTYAMIDLFYVGGRHDLTWAALHAGGTVHIKPSSGFDALACVEYVCKHCITHVLWVPTMIYDILRVPELASFDTSHLRMIMCGGQVLSPEIVKRMQQIFPHTDFVQVYGLTEGGGSVTCMPAHMTRVKPSSSGRPSINVSIRISGEDGKDCPPNVDGEILVRAPSVTVGYWDDPETTAQQIEDDWLRTGDIGHLDEDGYIYVTGRKKDMIKSGGMNIYPSEIEDVLRLHPAVRDAVVIGIPHEKWGEQVCAIVETKEKADVSEAALIDWCAERLAGFKKPTWVRTVDAMPRTSSGKPQKFILRERFGRSGDPPAHPCPPTGSHKETIPCVSSASS